MTEIPSSIITALTKYQDRPFILYLEKDLIKFIKNSILGNIKQPEYVIQAQYLKNSYYRLLSHQLCQYYHLQHWNNQSNEIVVTPSDNFDYESFTTQIDDEASGFVKVADVAAHYRAEHSPPPLSTTTPPLSDSGSGHSHSAYQQQPQQRPQQHPHQHHQPTRTSTQDSIESGTSSADSSHVRIVKPKMIVKKIINKPSTPDIEVGEQQQLNVENFAKLKLEQMNAQSPASEASVSTSASESTKSTIESQRASKEALYKKLREEIFLKEDEDQGDGEEEEDDDDGEEDGEGNNGDNDNNNEEEENGHGSSSLDHAKPEGSATLKSKSFNNKYDRDYKTQYKPRQHRTHPQQSQQQQSQHQIPQQYAYSMAQQMQMQIPYQQIYAAPSGLSPTIPQAGSVPIMYSPYYPTQPMLPHTYGYPAYNMPPYDRETERRLLNNPYIIIPDDNGHNERYGGGKPSVGRSRGGRGRAGGNYHYHHHQQQQQQQQQHHHGTSRGSSPQIGNVRGGGRS
ncbi:uncharacterized protein LODBEIA_P33390 [Lodderomyces beijingensis]|uniref:R3H domain-containing protein n=1 Tax=Lodderomyces beijingensis TaxID=1775926 RepID=A0ABP0ZLT2_9ASCO